MRVLGFALLAAACAAAVPLASAAAGYERATLERALARAHASFAGVASGSTPASLPWLAQADPKLFGMALVTTDAQIVLAGDAAAAFPLQSLAKVFTLARVLEDLGPQAVLDAVGVDATGLPADSVAGLERDGRRALNPLSHAGAILATSLVPGADAEARWTRIVTGYGDFAGHLLSVDAGVYEAASANGAREQAIAKLLEAHGLLHGDAAPIADLYARQSSVSVTPKDLAVMAATLANGGRNPITQQQLLAPRLVPKLLAVMATAGLGQESGRWLFEAGLPAASAESGAMLAVAPGRFGIAAYSPRLDAAGNSVRARKAIQSVAEQLGVHPWAATPR